MKKLKSNILKKGNHFYYLFLSFMAILFLCFLVMSAQFIHSNLQNFENTKIMYNELAEQAMNSISVLVSDLDNCAEKLKFYADDSLEELAFMNREEFLASDLSGFYRLYLISYHLSNQVPGNVAYLYFKNSDYIMGINSIEDIRTSGELDMLGIEQKDWESLINASSAPLTFIQKTDQMTFSRLFLSKEILSDVILIMALPEDPLSTQMKCHYLPENSHVLMITQNDQFVMSDTEYSNQISLGWDDLKENTVDTISFGDSSYYLYSQKIDDFNIKLAVLIPNILKKQTLHSILVTLPAFFLIWLICGGCVSWFFAVHLYRPVLFLLRNLPFQDYSKSQKNDLTRIQDLVESLQNKAQSYEETLNEKKMLLANNIFARLLNHSLDWNEHISQILDEADFPVHSASYLIFLISANPAENSKGNDEPLCVLESLDFRNTLKQTWEQEGFSCYIILSNGYFIGIAETDHSEKTPDFKKIQQLLPADCAVCFSVAVSGIHNTMTELPLAYSEALQAADSLLLNDSDHIVCFYSELENSSFESQNPFLSGTLLLSNYIQSANFDAAEKELNNLILLLGKPSTPNRSFHRNLDYLVQTVMISAESIRSIDIQKLNAFKKEFSFDTHASAFALCQQLQTFVLHLPDFILSDNYEEEILQEIVTYIREKYTDPSLSAGAVADSFHVSLSWLSIHFKSATGLGFLDYVHKCRISEAKKLLSSTNISIKNIAEMVGYTNSATFSRAFSRYEGVTPSWYRSSRQNTPGAN